MGWARAGCGRWAFGLLALALLTHCGVEVGSQERSVEGAPPGAASTSAEGLATTLTFGASADARVEAAAPTRNFGGASLLVADRSPDVESYLRFDVSGVMGTVTRATLRLYASDGTSDGPRVFRSDGGWTEGGLTWSNRPALRGGALDDVGPIASGTWVELDVTEAVRGNGEVALAVIATSGNGADFLSRESGRVELRPRLVVIAEPVTTLPPECLPRLETFARGLEPQADAYVSRDAPDQGFGGEPALRVDGAPWLESYLQFYVSTEDLRVRDARLELSAFDPTSNGPRLYRTGDAWDESVTWNTRPGLMGAPLGNLGIINAGTRVSYDVTGTVSAEGTYSFGLIPESSNGVDFHSREVGTPALRPSLRVTLETPLFCSYRGAGGGVTRWVRRYGGAGDEQLDALATLPEGGFVTVGRFGEALFPEAEGLALARYTEDGRHLWTRVVATADVRARALALTPSGDILVAGNYEGSPDLGTGRLPPVLEGALGQALFLARFSPTGETVWSRGFVATDASGVSLPVYPAAVASGADGSVFVTGFFQGRMELGGGVLSSGTASDPSAGPPIGGFLAGFFPDGAHRWSRAFESDGSFPTSGGDAVAVDAGGNLLVGGRGTPVTDVGDGPLGESAPFIAKYTPAGSLLWKRVLSGATGAFTALRDQGSERVAFIGNLAGTFTFAGETFSGLPFTPEGFIGAVTRTGADVWIQNLGGAVRLRELAVSPDGALTVLGEGFGEFDVGGGPLGVDVRILAMPFVARFSPEGEHRWSRALAAGLSPHLGLQAGGVLLGGHFGPRPIEVDGRIFTPRGPSDLLFLELTSAPEDGATCPAGASMELRPGASELRCFPVESTGELTRDFRYELRNTGAAPLYGVELSAPYFGRACLFEGGWLRFTNDPRYGEEPPPIVTCQFDLLPGETLSVGGAVLGAYGAGEDVLCIPATATASDACGERLTTSATAVSRIYGWLEDPAECDAAAPSPVCSPFPFLQGR